MFSLVLRTDNIPHIKRKFYSKRRFFVTVTNLATTKKTESVQINGQTVQWNQRLGALYDFSFFNLIFGLKVQFSSTQLPSHLILCLYEKRLTHRDVVIGTREIPVTTQRGPSSVRFPVRSTNWTSRV